MTDQQAADRLVSCMPLLIGILASRARWGWAQVLHRELVAEVTPKRGDADLKRTPVMEIQSAVGPSLVIRLTEDELAALGPCPNL
jgi:hypothetical protein